MNSNVVVVGRVANKLEIREVSSNGKNYPVGKFMVAVGAGQTSSDSKEPSYFVVETWNKKQQELLGKSLKLGEFVVVTGNAEFQKFDRADGGKGASVIIKNPDQIQFLGAAQQQQGIANINFAGRLTRDVEQHNIDTGDKKHIVAKFTLASNTSKDNTTFIDVECWNDNAKPTQYISKGSLVSVNGNLSIDTYEKDGRQYSSVKIKNPEINFLGKKRDSADAAHVSASAAAKEQK